MQGLSDVQAVLSRLKHQVSAPLSICAVSNVTYAHSLAAVYDMIMHTHGLAAVLAEQ